MSTEKTQDIRLILAYLKDLIGKVNELKELFNKKEQAWSADIRILQEEVKEIKDELENLKILKVSKSFLQDRIEISQKQLESQLDRVQEFIIQFQKQNEQSIKELYTRLEGTSPIAEKKKEDVENRVINRLVMVMQQYELARSYEEQEQYESAIEEYQKILEFSPYEKDCYYNLGFLYCKINQPTQALEYWRKYLEVHPKGREAEHITRQMKALEAYIKRGIKP